MCCVSCKKLPRPLLSYISHTTPSCPDTAGTNLPSCIWPAGHLTSDLSTSSWSHGTASFSSTLQTASSLAASPHSFSPYARATAISCHYEVRDRPAHTKPAQQGLGCQSLLPLLESGHPQDRPHTTVVERCQAPHMLSLQCPGLCPIQQHCQHRGLYTALLVGMERMGLPNTAPLKHPNTLEAFPILFLTSCMTSPLLDRIEPR